MVTHVGMVEVFTSLTARFDDGQFLNARITNYEPSFVAVLRGLMCLLVAKIQA